MTFLLTRDARWYRVAIFGIAFMVVPLFFQYVFIAVTPHTFWFNYDKIQVEPVIEAGNYIEVLSFAEVKRPVKIVWNDVLFCRNNGGYEFITSLDTGKNFTEPITFPRTVMNIETGIEEFVPWRFPTEGRLVGGEQCYIATTVTGDFNSQKKVQKLQSNDFLIK